MGKKMCKIFILEFIGMFLFSVLLSFAIANGNSSHVVFASSYTKNISSSISLKDGDTLGISKDSEMKISGGTEETPIVITVEGTVKVNGKVFVEDGSWVKITGGGTLIRNFTGSYMIKNSGNLVVEDVTIDGGATWNEGAVSSSTNTNTKVDSNKNPLLYNADGTMTLGEGCVVQNALNKATGTSVYTWGTITNRGSSFSNVEDTVLIIDGATIQNCYSQKGSGGIYSNNGTIEISETTITGNVTDYNGGGICLENSTVCTMTGGSITGNTSNGGNTTSGGVYIATGTELSASGNVIISENEAGSNASNICLKSGTQVKLSGELENNADIGISFVSYTAGDTAVTATGGYTITEQDLEKITLNTPDVYELYLDTTNNKIELKEHYVVSVQIGTGKVQYFTAFSAAAAEANTAGTGKVAYLTLLDNIELNEQITITSKWEIKTEDSDNPYTLSSAQQYTMNIDADSAELIIKSGNYISSTNEQTPKFIRVMNGNLHIESGVFSSTKANIVYIYEGASAEIEGDDTKLISTSSSYAAVNCQGNLTIKQGTVSAENNYAVLIGTKGVGEISGENTRIESKSSEYPCVRTYGELEVDGGTIVSEGHVGLYASEGCDTTISGGTIQGGGTSPAVYMGGTSDDTTGKVTITGSSVKFSNADLSQSLLRCTYGTMKITDGVKIEWDGLILYVEAGGDVVLDGKETSFTSEHNYYYMLQCSGGKLTINNGVYKTACSVVYLYNYGRLFLNGGTLECTKTNNNVILMKNSDKTGVALNVSGGTIKNVTKTTAKAINNGTSRTIYLSGGNVEGEIVTITPVSVADDYKGSGCKINVGTIGEEGDYLVDTTKAENGNVYVTGSTDTKLFQVGTYNSYMYLSVDTENNRLLGTNRYPVLFDLNYEDRASTDYITAYNQTVFTDLFGNTNQSLCPNREGYTFAGWYSNSDYSEQIIDVSGRFIAGTSLTTTVGNWKSLVSNTVLYAKWIQAPSIISAELPDGILGESYNQTIEASDKDLEWEIQSGTLPNGLTLQNGVISGIPIKTGTFTFTVQTSNLAGSDTKEYTILIGKKILTSISIQTEPYKNSYVEGNRFDLTGLVTMLHYDDESTETVEYNDTKKPFVLLSAFLSFVGIIILFIIWFSREQKKKKIIATASFISILIIFLLTSGYSGVKLANVGTIIITILDLIICGCYVEKEGNAEK